TLAPGPSVRPPLIPAPLVPAARRPRSALCPYTTLFRSQGNQRKRAGVERLAGGGRCRIHGVPSFGGDGKLLLAHDRCCGNRHGRSEEHTSELQSRENLACRLLLEKKNSASQEDCGMAQL